MVFRLVVVNFDFLLRPLEKRPSFLGKYNLLIWTISRRKNG